jgi:hypothetical protein
MIECFSQVKHLLKWIWTRNWNGENIKKPT